MESSRKERALSLGRIRIHHLQCASPASQMVISRCCARLVQSIFNSQLSMRRLSAMRKAGAGLEPNQGCSQVFNNSASLASNAPNQAVRTQSTIPCLRDGIWFSLPEISRDVSPTRLKYAVAYVMRSSCNSSLLVRLI